MFCRDAYTAYMGQSPVVWESSGRVAVIRIPKGPKETPGPEIQTTNLEKWWTHHVEYVFSFKNSRKMRR